jgi:hypothetical protein
VRIKLSVHDRSEACGTAHECRHGRRITEHRRIGPVVRALPHQTDPLFRHAASTWTGSGCGLSCLVQLLLGRLVGLCGRISPRRSRRRGFSHNEIARLTARLSAAEALVNELRARLDQLTSRLSDTQAELAGAQDEVEAATARALAAAQAEQAVRQAPMLRGGQGGAGHRLRAAWRETSAS